MKFDKKDKLSVYWNKKEEDIECWYPLGFQTIADNAYIFNHIFTKEHIEELKRRGYDITTLKFEICPKLPNTKRFETLTKKYIKNES